MKHFTSTLTLLVIFTLTLNAQVLIGAFRTENNILEIRYCVSEEDRSMTEILVSGSQVTLMSTTGLLECIDIESVSLQWRLASVLHDPDPKATPGNTFYTFTQEGAGVLDMAPDVENVLFRIRLKKGESTAANPVILEDREPVEILQQSLSLNLGNTITGLGGELYSGVFHNPGNRTDYLSIERDGGLAFFPNPTTVKSQVQVTLTPEIHGRLLELYIYNTAGELIMKQTVSGGSFYSPSEPGFYIIRTGTGMSGSEACRLLVH